MNKKKHNSLVRAIIGLIIIGLCIIWIIRIYWPVITGERSYIPGPNFYLGLSAIGIIHGGLLMFFGIYGALESNKSRALFLIVSGLTLLSFILYNIINMLIINWYIFGLDTPSRDLYILTFLGSLAPIILASVLPIVMIGLGSRKISKNRRKSMIKEGIERKVEAAPNVTYMVRIEKEVGESEAERTNYICGYCGLKNNLKTIDEDRGIFQCLNCGAENHLLK